MKKKIWIPILIIVALIVLFFPFSVEIYKDGGTRSHASLTYRVVQWSKFIEGRDLFKKTSVYFFPHNFKSIDSLWEFEKDEAAALFPSKDFRPLEYTHTWLDKQSAEKYEKAPFTDIVITEIYANCFFARTVIPLPYEVKLNGTLSDEWCVGDQIIATYDNIYYDQEGCRMEADFTDVKVSNFEPDAMVCYKPVIYLYPEKTTDVDVKLSLNGEFVCTYPKYENGWRVTASPDGTLTDKNGQVYNYLYWEGDIHADYSFEKGFCVKGEDTSKFLENALSELGLSRKEANEFIVYWLPLMEKNPYNIISFQREAYTDAARLEINPNPDTLIRVFMTFKATDKYVEIEKQELNAPKRQGFAVVEWGGTEVK